MSLVNTETGEVIQSVALAIPRPHEVTSPYELCDAIEVALPLVDDPAELAEAKAKLLAIETYMSQHTKQGRARIEAALRRIEIRMGEVLGEPRQGERTDLFPTRNKLEIPKKERHELRLLAAHADVAETVIASADDAKPPSRRKVLDAIRDHLAKQKEESVDTRTAVRDLAKLGLNASQIAEDLGVSAKRVATIAREEGVVLPGTQAARDQRESVIAELAASGHTSSQIAKQLGISAEHTRLEARRLGIEIPADKAVGRTRKLDSTRIVKGAVDGVDGIGMLFDQVDYAALDPEDIKGWLPVLETAIRSLQTLRSELKKVSQP